MHQETAPTGLRERKRKATRATIASVAIELFDREGFRETTLPQIAERADVSPRTVSGYFPTKESLAFPDADRDFESLAARLRDRSAGESATEALRAWISAWLDEVEGREAELAMRRRAIRASEEPQRYERSLFGRAQGPIAEAIARDLGVAAGDLGPRMAAAATLTLFELLGEDCGPVGDLPGDPTLSSVLEAVDRVLRFVEGGVAALAD